VAFVDAGQAPGELDSLPGGGERGDAGQVLIVSPDERWLRVLDVTLRLGGYRTVSRRSIADANRMRAGDEAPVAIVLDLGVDSGSGEAEAVRRLVGERAAPAVVILPERLGDQRDAFAAIGATVLVRPYRPSELYAALRAPAAAPDRPVQPSSPPVDRPGS
jgi:DNA-binding response OmpR family regulator